MKIAFLLAFILAGFTARAQSVGYCFNLHEDALNLLDNGERDTILQRLDGFLAYKNAPANKNPFVDTAYTRTNLNPFELLMNIETEGKDLNFYKPTVLAVLPAIRHQQYVIKMAYLGVTAQGEAKQRLIYTLIAEKKHNNYYFFNAINYNTRHWNKKQVGSISYTFPNHLDITKARQMDRMNKILAKKFSVPIIPIVYYRCEDPEQLLKMMGCDYINNMYLSTTGGFAQSWNNTLLAGNNSELYVHELVHFYTASLYKTATRVMNEGYATYLGGSGGLSLQEAKLLAEEYLDKKPNANITHLFLNFERINNGIPFTYIASGLICRDIETKYGFDKIDVLFKAQTNDEYFKALQSITGVGKAGFAKYVNQLINGN